MQQIEYKKRHRIYDDFTATVAHCEEEACKLIEAGFDFVCDYN
jgi:hypothetical protein